MTDRPYGTSTETGAYTQPAMNQSGMTQPEGSTTDVAKDQARSVAGDAKQGGQQVAQTAKEQTQEVASEAKDQARQLYQQLRGEMGDQATSQHQRAASGLRSLGDELGAMARGDSSQQGVASDLAQQASDRVSALAGWLESREPGDVLNEVTSFARRKPGTFLAAAAAVGFLGGRLTRGIAAENSDSGGAGGTGQPLGSQGVPRASGTDFSTGSTGYNPGSATAAPQATTQPTPLPGEPAWPAPSGAVPPTGTGSATGMAPGTGEERI